MSTPSDDSKPRLATGCRWGSSAKAGTAEETRMLLFPEGAIKLQGTGLKILDHCDGQRTFAEIIGDLQNEFGKSDPEKIRADISMFLEQLQKKRIVDY